MLGTHLPSDLGIELSDPRSRPPVVYPLLRAFPGMTPLSSNMEMTTKAAAICRVAMKRVDTTAHHWPTCRLRSALVLPSNLGIGLFEGRSFAHAFFPLLIAIPCTTPLSSRATMTAGATAIRCVAMESVEAIPSYTITSSCFGQYPHALLFSAIRFWKELRSHVILLSHASLVARLC